MRCVCGRIPSDSLSLEPIHAVGHGGSGKICDGHILFHVGRHLMQSVPFSSPATRQQPLPFCRPSA